MVIDAATASASLIWAELDSNACDAAAHDAAHPSRQELRRGPSLHRRAAQPEERRPGNTLAGARAGSPSSATTSRARGRSRRRTRYARRSSSRSRRPGSPARPSMWRGTSRSPAARASPRRCSRSATTPSGSSATPTSPTDRSRALAPPFTVTSVQNFTPARTRSSLREVTGTFTVPCYLTTPLFAHAERDDGRRRVPLQLEQPDAMPTQKPGNTATAQFDCIIPTRGQRGLAGARLAVRPRAARLGRPRSTPGTSRTWRRSTTCVLRHRLVGACRARTCPSTSRPSGPQQVPGGRRPAAAGRAQHPLPRPTDGELRTASPPTRRSRTEAASRSSTPPTCTTTATARAGSWAASRPPSRPTTRAPCWASPAWTTAGCCSSGAPTSRRSPTSCSAAPGGGYTDARSTR